MGGLFGALYTWIMDRPTKVSWIEVEMKPTRANQYQSQVYASHRNDAHAHTKCTAVIVPSTTNLLLTLLNTCAQGYNNGRIDADARVVVLPLLLQYVVVPIFGRVALDDGAQDHSAV